MKYPELEHLNLNGYKCYLREHNKKGRFVYYLKKEINHIHLKYKCIKSFIENIEFQTLHDLTDIKIK
jgi:hypothetical protein